MKKIIVIGHNEKTRKALIEIASKDKDIIHILPDDLKDKANGKH